MDPHSISVIMHNIPDSIAAYHGKMQQLDVYTSLIDLLIMSHSIDQRTLWKTTKGNQWQGLGCSIFNPKKYSNTVNDNSMSTSSDILKGRFFSNIR